MTSRFWELLLLNSSAGLIRSKNKTLRINIVQLLVTQVRPPQTTLWFDIWSTLTPHGFCWKASLKPRPTKRESLTNRAMKGPLLVSWEKDSICCLNRARRLTQHWCIGYQVLVNAHRIQSTSAEAHPVQQDIVERTALRPGAGHGLIKGWLIVWKMVLLSTLFLMAS